MEYIGIAKSIADLGFQTTFTAVVLYFAYKYMDTKFFKDEAKIARKYNLEQDEKENQESKSKLKTLQIYLEENQERIYAKGIDRVSVWLNHNGTRNGKIHFIFYSLIAEISKRGLQKHIENPVGSQKLPYYVFADYEELVIKNNGPVYVHDVQEELTGAALNIAEDLGTKSVVIAPIYNLRGGIDGLIFFGSAFQELQEPPKVENLIIDIRTIFIK